MTHGKVMKNMVTCSVHWSKKVQSTANIYIRKCAILYFLFYVWRRYHIFPIDKILGVPDHYRLITSSAASIHGIYNKAIKLREF